MELVEARRKLEEAEAAHRRELEETKAVSLRSV